MLINQNYLLQLQMHLTGTLVIMIPTKDGIIAAADSRTTIGGKFYDVRKKLHTILDSNIIFTITGTAEFIPGAPSGVDISEWLIKAPALYNGNKMLEKYLSNTKHTSINNSFLVEISKAFILSLKTQ